MPHWEPAGGCGRQSIAQSRRQPRHDHAVLQLMRIGLCGRSLPSSTRGIRVLHSASPRSYVYRTTPPPRNVPTCRRPRAAPTLLPLRVAPRQVAHPTTQNHANGLVRVQKLHRPPRRVERRRPRARRPSERHTPTLPAAPESIERHAALRPPPSPHAASTHACTTRRISARAQPPAASPECSAPEAARRAQRPPRCRTAAGRKALPAGTRARWWPHK